MWRLIPTFFTALPSDIKFNLKFQYLLSWQSSAGLAIQAKQSENKSRPKVCPKRGHDEGENRICPIFDDFLSDQESGLQVTT